MAIATGLEPAYSTLTGWLIYQIMIRNHARSGLVLTPHPLSVKDAGTATPELPTLNRRSAFAAAKTADPKVPWIGVLVGMEGFEPPASASQTRRSDQAELHSDDPCLDRDGVRGGTRTPMDFTPLAS